MSTHIDPFAPTHKMLCEPCAQPGSGGGKRAAQRLASEAGAYRGEMHSFPDHTAKLGLVAPSPDLVAAPAPAWDWSAALPAARTLWALLVRSACPISGEVIVRLDDIPGACGLRESDALDALLDLQKLGAFVYLKITEGGLLYCGLDVDDNAYYGDDETIPCDSIDEDLEQLGVQLIDPDDLPWAQPTWQTQIFAKTRNRCFYCISGYAEHVDHMLPRSRGGGNHPDNLIGACAPCNLKKKDRTVEEFRAYLAYRMRLPSISMVRFFGEQAQ